MPKPQQQTQEQETPPQTSEAPPATSETPPEAPAQDTKADEKSASDADINWGELLGGDDDSGETDEPVAAPEAEQEPDKEPAPPPPKTPPAQPPETPPQPQPQAAPQPPQPQAETVPQEPEPPQPTAQDQAEQLNKWRAAAEAEVTKSLHMTEDEGIAVINAPHEELPKIAGKLAVQVQEMVFNNIGFVLPGLIRQVIDSVRSEGRTEKALLDSFPKLRGQKQTYEKVMQAMKTAYPKLEPEKLIQLTGRSAYEVLGIKEEIPAIEQPTPGGNGAQQPQGNVRVEPFTPGAPGAGGPPVQKQGPKNMWDELDREWSNDELREI